MRDWLYDHQDAVFAVAVALVFAVIIGGAFYGAYARHQNQVALCVSAFEYTRDQCEFFVTNRIIMQR